MAKKSKKKKKQNKRQHFVPAPISTEKIPELEMTKSASVEKKITKSSQKKEKEVVSKPQDSVADPKIQILKQESRTTAIIGGALIILLFGLWVLFEHTGVGAAVYRLIKV